MAGRTGVVKLNNVASGTSVKTLIQLIAAANHAIRILEIGISFQGTSATAQPVLVDVIRQTTAGTMSALTPVKGDDSCGDTLATTATHTATAEPTAGDILRTWSIHPQQGLVYQVPDLHPLPVGAADRLGLRVTAAVDVDVDAYIVFEE